jgi:hypothetical protein
MNSPYIASPHAEAETRESDRQLSRVQDVPWQDGTESLHPEGWRRCLRTMPGEKSSRQSAQAIDAGSHDPAEIIVCFTQSGKAAHALHLDCRTALGPWIMFASGAMLDHALVYLGATEDQMAEHRDALRRCGQGSSQIRLMPNRKNLLRIDYGKL